MNLPSYNELNSALETIDFGERASELHGFLCGAVAVDISYPLDTSIGTLSPELAGVLLNDDLQSCLNSTFEQVRSQMTDPVLNLELVLPEDDNIDLSKKVSALASWCDGYLFGLANAGLQDASSLPEDTAEILQDLARIAQLQGADTGDEDDEISFNELFEYVRMSALLVAEELQPIKMTTEIQ